MTSAIRNATLSAIPASLYISVSLVAGVISGWCVNAGGLSCYDGYNPTNVLRLVSFKLALMLGAAWGALFLGFLPFPRVRLRAVSAFVLGILALVSAILLFAVLGSFALALFSAVAFAWSYWAAMRPNKSLERTREG
jgi:hypothetical protein